MIGFDFANRERPCLFFREDGIQCRALAPWLGTMEDGCQRWLCEEHKHADPFVESLADWWERFDHIRTVEALQEGPREVQPTDRGVRPK